MIDSCGLQNKWDSLPSQVTIVEPIGASYEGLGHCE